MISYKMYEKNLISSINMNVMHHFRKSEILSISLKICVSLCHDSICIHIKTSCAFYIPSISNLFRNTEQRYLFKMMPNMNGFVNRLLRYWTVLSTFQMPLVETRIKIRRKILLYVLFLKHNQIGIYLLLFSQRTKLIKCCFYALYRLPYLFWNYKKVLWKVSEVDVYILGAL